jgi:L-iditol 2-dehydrogenase
MLPQTPDPGPGQVLVKVRAIGICGSDLHWYLEGGIGANRAVYPQVLGHEPSGEIVAVGPGVTGRKPGERVTLEPAVHCLQCEPCRKGRYNQCLHSRFLGSPHFPGALREYVVVPERNVVPLPEGMGFAEATVIEPLAVIVHVFQMMHLEVGDTVAIIGAGSIGMLHAAMARVSGASRVFCADKVPHRLELARGMGATDIINKQEDSVAETILDATRGRGVDVVIDCAAKADTVNESIAVARAGGKVMLVGLPSDSYLPIDVHGAMAREIDIQCIRRSNRNDEVAIELLHSGRIPTSFITHRLPLERTPEAFEHLAHYSDGVGKAVITL